MEHFSMSLECVCHLALYIFTSCGQTFITKKTGKKFKNSLFRNIIFR